MTDPNPASVYDLTPSGEAESQATFAVLVDNEPGVLHRLVGLFAARGYNIESLTVAETDRKAHTSRVTIVTRGTPTSWARSRPSSPRWSPPATFRMSPATPTAWSASWRW